MLVEIKRDAGRGKFTLICIRLLIHLM